MNPDLMRDETMMALFRQEAEAQTAVLARDLLLLERNPQLAAELEACMRAAHSLKGAARIVGLDAGVRVAHVMEDCLVAAQSGRLRLGSEHIDALLHGADLLLHIADPVMADDAGGQTIDRFVERLERFLTGEEPVLPDSARPLPPPLPEADPEKDEAAEARLPEVGERVLRVSAEHLNLLLDLSSKSLVELRQIRPLVDALERLRRQQATTGRALAALQEGLQSDGFDAAGQARLADIRRHWSEQQEIFTRSLQTLDEFSWQAGQRTRRLYDTVLACRMRPFADVTVGLARMVRDLGRSLGKQVRLEIDGESTPVDRDVLTRLEAPLMHLLRNAVDHGIEGPDVRLGTGKPPEGLIVLRASHRADKLRIELEDDGGGVDLKALRRTIVERRLTNADTADRLTEAELLAFLFLPGFSLRDAVTEVSGRGVGLDAVHHEMRELHGSVQVSQQSNRGTRFVLEMPLTLSIVRSLVVEISGEAYAFPLAHIERMQDVPRADIVQLDSRQHFWLRETPVGLISACQILQRPDVDPDRDSVPVVVLRDRDTLHGLAVDKLLGEQTLVVVPLDPRLGKIQDISAGAVLDSGAPVLILDVEDLLRSVEKLVSDGGLHRVDRRAGASGPAARKRILVVDDSLTVRELERKLLQNRGYQVSVAVDGMDGWNMLRAEPFDLLVTDIDMPRMNGIELVTLVRRDSRLQALPVMVVSYKDREEDRRRGLDAGADYYLAKASFHDEALLDAVVDLIGEAQG
ncbi:two-component system sensor histidine kinase and response regulator WspE [Fluviicoccus keumensis]|uniref:Chemotaxis protein CheA n=1 Tax=Fluviicoccus keumensis TaxID=1435465 RepID=A0A4V2G681_9GAMM|nr:hybrid sensor histidine kinase/response regulator [Fluviicoccus keumensis]RZU47686.1 two-component system sensor histidine kinase and response regulator WspE [Fluviicoccus keumensis]